MYIKSGHIHKFLRVKFQGKLVYRCQLACSRTLDKDSITGQESICWRCGKPFIITRENTYLHPSNMTAKPICCRDVTKNLKDRAINKIFKAKDVPSISNEAKEEKEVEIEEI